jgi:hypothetical protein
MDISAVQSGPLKVVGHLRSSKSRRIEVQARTILFGPLLFHALIHQLLYPFRHINTRTALGAFDYPVHILWYLMSLIAGLFRVTLGIVKLSKQM